MTDAQIKYMAEQFLRWKLPENWHPDGGISFEPVGNAGSEHEYKREPTGTNLFDYTQAVAMVRHMIDGMPRTNLGRRVSMVKGDPGERLYGELCGDDQKFKVMLDGVEQKTAKTADEALGFVDRIVTTPKGNIAINMATGEILEERVYGRVEIVLI